jgi:GH25 family lysozyme M1 (1,4-beta-N-acetylmuramidase)
MAVKKYRYSDEIQITEHFNSREWRCKPDSQHNAQHDYYIDTDLVLNMEKFFTVIPQLFGIKVSKICLTSGYRCRTHDIEVGGSGSGPHVDGYACDFIAYDDTGAPISSKIICCAAQEIGFRGIANITSAYIYTHCDMKDRKNGTGQSYRWFGNEVYGNHIVTDDFWTYYGLTKKTNTTDAEVVKLKGIDVSKFQGDIDFSTTAANIDFAVLRAGYGKLTTQEDKKFQRNYAGFKKTGTPIGAYWYCYATSAAEAREEAQACLATLKGKQFELPIFYDILEDDHIPKLKAVGNISKLINEIVPAFCDVLEQNGYFVGVYCNTSGYTYYLNDSNKQRYVQWVADWGGTCGYTGEKVLWQYSSKGRIPGIVGDVDKDYAYTDFAVIKEKGFNGWNAADYKPNSKTPDVKPENPAVQPNNPETPTPDEAMSVFEKILKQVQEINQKLGK